MVPLKKKDIKGIHITFKNKDIEILNTDKSINYFEIYLEIFLSKLKINRFKCIGYDLIHIIVSEEYDYEIINKNTSIEKFCSVAFISNDYINWDDIIRNKMSLDSIYNWLKDLVSREEWNVDIINEIYNEIQEKWIETELVFKEVDYKVVFLKVTYYPCAKDLYKIYFTLTDKKTNEEYKREMNTWNKDFLNMWLKSIKISPKNIQMRPGISSYWDITKPFDINIKNFIKGSNFKINYKENIV